MTSIINLPQHIQIKRSNTDSEYIDKETVKKRIIKKGDLVVINAGDNSLEFKPCINLSYTDISSPTFASADDLVTYLLACCGGSGSYAGVVTITDTLNSFEYTMFPLPGTLSEGEARWQILRVDTSTTDKEVIQYAEGNLNFDKVASDYASYTYKFIQ